MVKKVLKLYTKKIIGNIRFISSSLTQHVDDLSEIQNENCSDKNCKSQCEFKGVKNNELMIVKTAEQNS